MLLPLLAGAQTPLDARVQAPTLTAPQRGSLVGQYARTAFGPMDVSRGGFSLATPFRAPSERGDLLAGIFPVYSPDSGLSEWGMGWQTSLAFTRWRVRGALDYATDELTGPWGRFVRGDDGAWYPLNLSGGVRLEESGTELVALLPDGSRWRFGAEARVVTGQGTYAWYLREVETALGRKTMLEYTANASGRLFLQRALYGGVGEAFQYEVELQYEPLAVPFRDLRSGQSLSLDRRVTTVVARTRDVATGTFVERWRHGLTYQAEGLGPSYFLSEVSQVFPSGASAPVTRYSYHHASERLSSAALRPVPKLTASVNKYKAELIQPHRTTPLDADEDGRLDMEHHSDFTLLRQTDEGYTQEALPPTSPTTYIYCRPPVSPNNEPRTLARLRPTDVDVNVVSLVQMNASQTRLTVCDRPGQPLQQQVLTGNWTLGAKVRLADVNRDLQPDLVRVGPGSYEVLPNTSGPGGFGFGTVRTGSLTPLINPDTAWVHDFNGDGLADLIARTTAGLTVWLGRGDLTFETQGTGFRLMQGTLPVSSLANFSLKFTDVNKDGLTDVLLTRTSGGTTQVFVNDGKDFVQTSAPGLLAVSALAPPPMAGDYAGSGDTEVLYMDGGVAKSLAVDGPETSLLKTADDGRGTVLRFEYARGPAVPGTLQRQSLLAALRVESSGHEPVRYTYDYGEPTLHGEGRFLVGFDQVTRTDPRLTHAVSFLNGDGYAGLLSSATRRDAHTPQLQAHEARVYEDALFHGVPWKRLKEEVRGWSHPQGLTPPLEDKTEYLAYEAGVCPSRVRHTSAHGTLLTETVRASVPGLGLAMHCLDASTVRTGTHADPTLDFRHETQVDRDNLGLVTAVRSVSPTHALTVQQVTYAPDATIASITTPGHGQMTFDYDAATRLLRQVTEPDGVVTRVTARDPLTDAILALEVDRGSLVYQQFFRYDGLGRLGKRWDSLAGSELNPVETFSYRYATADAPASVFSSTLVDAQGGSARDTVDYLTASGGQVTSARRTPSGWVFDGILQRTEADAAVRTWLRPSVAGTVNVLELEYADLLAGASSVAFSRGSAFGHTVESSTTFHAGVERELATTLGLSAGALARTATENGTWSTGTTLDAASRVVAFADEAATPYGYRYDALGRLVQVDLPDGKKHRVRHDAHGRVSLLEREGVASVEYAYDTVTGHTLLKRFSTPAGAVQRQVAFTYDGLGRLATETYSDFAGGTPQVYRYYRDGASPSQPTAQTARGFVTAVEGEGYLKRVAYREDGRVASRTLQLHGWRTVEQAYTYADGGDVASETTTVRAADGSVLSAHTKAHRWDTSGRLTESWMDGQVLALFDYDGNGRPASAAFATGDSVTLGYDPLTRARVSLTQVGPGWNSSTGLQMNARGLVDSESLSVGGQSLQREYSYSAQRFLTVATDDGGSYAYGFSPSGLPVSIEEDGQVRTLVTSGNTLTAGGVTYTFDALGRTVTKGDLTLTYGPNGHAATATRGAQTWDFLYDENGQRLLKRMSGTPVAAYLDGGLYLDGAGLTEPFRFGGQLVGLLRNGAFQMVAADLRGTVVADADGTLRRVSPFGNRAVHPDVAPALDFVQKAYDADLGLVRMGVRDYDPALNRFLTPDPLFLEEPGRCLGSPVECNLYGYAGGNPVSYADPTGQYLESAIDIASLGMGIHSISQWNEKTTTLDKVLDVGGLVLDGVALALPVIPGGAGIGLKALRAGDKAVDALQAADKVGDASKLLNHADEAAAVASKADEVAQASTKVDEATQVAAQADEAASASKAATNDPQSYLYRGVSSNHPQIDAARRGEVIPGNVNGTVTPEAHNLGGVAGDSPYTSWSRELDVAQTHAGKNGPGGVVLRVPTGLPPKGATWSWEWSPDVYGESEVLMRGIREGVEVLTK
ncbi:RHS repeat-associated core domain-containing protein [Myxococcaceae bacterium GXIMD 01537]